MKWLVFLLSFIPLVASAQDRNWKVIANCGEANGDSYFESEHKWIEDGFKNGKIFFTYHFDTKTFDIITYNSVRDETFSMRADGGTVRLQRATDEDIVATVEYWHGISVYTFYRNKNYFTYLESKNYRNTSRTTVFTGSCEYIERVQ